VYPPLCILIWCCCVSAAVYPPLCIRHCVSATVSTVLYIHYCICCCSSTTMYLLLCICRRVSAAVYIMLCILNYFCISAAVNMYPDLVLASAKVQIDYRLRYAQLIASFPWTLARGTMGLYTAGVDKPQPVLTADRLRWC